MDFSFSSLYRPVVLLQLSDYLLGKTKYVFYNYSLLYLLFFLVSVFKKMKIKKKANQNKFVYYWVFFSK